METQKIFEQLVEKSKSDPNILGFILIGSRGKGFENENSDYDVLMIVDDMVSDSYKTRFENQQLKGIDLGVQSLTDFKNYAAWDSPEAWDRYDFTHIKVMVDKTGEIANIAHKKGTIAENDKENLVKGSLDAYINSVFRSVKCIRNNNRLGALLEASCSIPYLLDVLFGIHNRPKPFLSYLKQELQIYPLEKLPWTVEQLTENIETIVTTADLKTQQDVLKEVEKLARDEGFGKVFDDWEGKDKWTMDYIPET